MGPGITRKMNILVAQLQFFVCTYIHLFVCPIKINGKDSLGYVCNLAMTTYSQNCMNVASH